jgi:hypothetical protein
MPEPSSPWERAQALRSRKPKSASQKQEEGLARLPGGRKQVNSGRTHFSHRDVRLNGFLIEARTTMAGSYRIDKSEFLDIKRDAMRTPPGLLPAIQPDIQDLRLITFELYDWQYMKQYIAALEAELGITAQ